MKWPVVCFIATKLVIRLFRSTNKMASRLFYSHKQIGHSSVSEHKQNGQSVSGPQMKRPVICFIATNKLVIHLFWSTNKMASDLFWSHRLDDHSPAKNDRFLWHASPSRVILCLEVRELHLFDIYIYIFVQVFPERFFCTQLYDIKYSYLIQIICTQLYGFKYSYQIQIILWFQVTNKNL